ncbi:MAG: DUF6572 domain-containing protein, partial [Planctomycetota bacterium]
LTRRSEETGLDYGIDLGMGHDENDQRFEVFHPDRPYTLWAGAWIDLDWRRFHSQGLVVYRDRPWKEVMATLAEDLGKCRSFHDRLTTEELFRTGLSPVHAVGRPGPQFTNTRFLSGLFECLDLEHVKPELKPEEPPEEVDFAGFDRSDGSTALLIFDSQAWDNPAGHLAAIQEKLNRYLSFIQSGHHLEKSLPGAETRPVVVHLAMKFDPGEEVLQGLAEEKERIAGEGVGLAWQVVPPLENARSMLARYLSAAGGAEGDSWATTYVS